MTEPSKPIWQSKVFWFNVLAILLMVGDLLTRQPWLSAQALQFVTFALAAGNIVLRFLTAGGVTAAPSVLGRGPVLPTIQDEYLANRQRMEALGSLPPYTSEPASLADREAKP